MSAFEIKPSQFRKVRGGPNSELLRDSAEPIEMIVKVEEENYVPSGVKVRGRIDATMFTGEASPATLHDLENDPKVKSVSVSRPLRIID
jgi:hypothetical protein